MKKSVGLILSLLFSSLLLAEEGTVRLNDLLSLARERSPRIKAARDEVEVFNFRIPQQKSLPDPMVGLSFQNMGLNRITIGEEVMSGIGLNFSQAVPFPGKLRLKGEIAEKAYERKKQSLTAVELEVKREVKESYFELFSLHKSVEILVEQKALLEKALSLTETKYAVGSGVQSDIFKAKVEISRMDEMITPMRRMIDSVGAKINSLLDFPPEKPVGVPEELAVYAIEPSLQDVQKLAEENSPMLKEASLMVEEGSKMVDLARKERYPNFVFEGGWDYKGKLPSMYEVMVGVEIPLHYGTKQAKMLEESLAVLRGSRNSLSSTENDISFMVTENFLKAKTSENLIQLYREKIIPQASLAVESALANYQVNKVDFLSLLNDINTLYSYQIVYYRELTQLWTSIAQLEEISSRDVVKWESKDEKDN